MNFRMVRHSQLSTKKVVRHTCNFNTYGPKKWYGTCRQAVLVTTGLLFEYMDYGSLEGILATNRDRNSEKEHLLKLTNVRFL